MQQEKVMILDTTGCYRQFIARTIRELHIYSEVVNPNKKREDEESYAAAVLAGEDAAEVEKTAAGLGRTIPILQMIIEEEKETRIEMQEPELQKNDEDHYTVQIGRAHV